MKKATIYDIAAALNISTATVNRALYNKPQVSKKTREKVLAKAHELGYTMNKAAKSLARHPIHLDILVYNRVPAFHDDIIAGAWQALRDLRDFNVTGNVHSFTGSDYDVHQQILEKIDQLLPTQQNGIVLLGTFNTSGFCDSINRYIESGRKVALLSSELPGVDHSFTIRQNGFLAGRLAAELLYRFCPGGTVAAFTGRSDVPAHIATIQGFCTECQARNVAVAAIYENHDDEAFAAFNTEKLIQEHPEVQGLYINSANSIAVCRKLEELGMSGKIHVVTSDLFDQLREYMKKDTVQATIFQDPYRQGYLAVEQLYKCVAEGETPEKTIYITPSVILQSNL